MNVEMIRMAPADARARVESYRRQLKRRVDAEYSAVLRGLEALAEGKAVVILPRVFAVCPFDKHGRPRIAIARADRKEVRFSWRQNTTAPALRFDAGVGFGRTASLAAARGLRIDVARSEKAPAQKEPGEPSWWNAHRDGFAMVPMIPAQVREEVGRFQAKNRFILWEVEQWADTSRTQPDRDPLLLRHLGGDAYSVEAAWDLTELERAVMGGRSLH